MTCPKCGDDRRSGGNIRTCTCPDARKYQGKIKKKKSSKTSTAKATGRRAKPTHDHRAVPHECTSTSCRYPAAHDKKQLQRWKQWKKSHVCNHPICKDYNQRSGRLQRSSSAKAAFVRIMFDSASAPAQVHIDHIVPLCLGGADCPCNMQALTEEDHKDKTADDIRKCREKNVRL